MRFSLQVLSIIVVAFLLELIFPWWSIALAAFTGGLLLKSKANFLAGFLSISLLWFINAWLIDFNSATPLAEKVAHLFQLSGKVFLLFVTATIGGLVGGFAALTGSLLKNNIG